MDDSRKTAVPKAPKWLAPLSCLAALPVATALLILRDQSWTRGSVAGLVIATVMAFGVVYVAVKSALRLPLYPPGYRNLATPTRSDRPWGVILQQFIIGCIGAILALFF